MNGKFISVIKFFLFSLIISILSCESSETENPDKNPDNGFFGWIETYTYINETEGIIENMIFSRDYYNSGTPDITIESGQLLPGDQFSFIFNVPYDNIESAYSLASISIYETGMGITDYVLDSIWHDATYTNHTYTDGNTTHTFRDPTYVIEKILKENYASIWVKNESSTYIWDEMRLGQSSFADLPNGTYNDRYIFSNPIHNDGLYYWMGFFSKTVATNIYMLDNDNEQASYLDPLEFETNDAGTNYIYGIFGSSK